MTAPLGYTDDTNEEKVVCVCAYHDSDSNHRVCNSFLGLTFFRQEGNGVKVGLLQKGDDFVDFGLGGVVGWDMSVGESIGLRIMTLESRSHRVGSKVRSHDCRKSGDEESER
jgi:hypothetical protein